MRNKKLAAFTIIELIAVMLLSTLIFSMAMLVIQIMQQQAIRQELDHEEVLQIEQLKALLKKDAYQSKAILIDNKQLFFDYDNYNISYTFNQNTVWRNINNITIHTDTFALASIQLDCYWLGQKTTNGLIDRMQWKSNFFEQPIEINIQKKYAHKTLMDLSNNN